MTVEKNANISDFYWCRDCKNLSPCWLNTAVQSKHNSQRYKGRWYHRCEKSWIFPCLDTVYWNEVVNRVYIFTALKRSLGQGNVFTPVCLSTGLGAWPACPLPCRPPPCMPPTTHAPCHTCPSVMHASHHTCPLPWTPQPRTPPAMHAPLLCTLTTTHATLPHMPLTPDTTRCGQWADGTHPIGMHSCSE